MRDPEIWGNSYWYVIHNIIPYLEDRSIIIANFYRLLPCELCSDHFENILGDTSRNYMTNDFRRYTYLLHKRVNTRLEKTYGVPNTGLDDVTIEKYFITFNKYARWMVNECKDRSIRRKMHNDYKEIMNKINLTLSKKQLNRLEILDVSKI